MKVGRTGGFTLIELLVTVSIVGLLATIAFPLMELTQRRTNEQELRLALRQIRGALDSYKQAVDEGRIVEITKGSGYPPDLETLVNGVVDAKSATRDKKIYFLRHIPLDPMVPVSPGGTPVWGLRSYASSAAEPGAGIDVFDVYSHSPGIGLNGIPYKDW